MCQRGCSQVQRRRGSLAPLIGSIEGLANTPAYRGLAMAVFEDLELVEFGNRIPFLTFEVVGEADPVSVASILADASENDIASDSNQAVVGYAAYGASVRASIEPLIGCFALDLFDDGIQLRPPANSGPRVLSADMLGNSADHERQSRAQREQSPASSMPATLRLSYYDAARDYQSGEARAVASDLPGREESIELAAVLGASDAKSLVHQMIARRWSRRDRLTLRLPPALLDLEPGDELELPMAPARWTVEKCTIDAFVVIVEGTPR